MAVRTIVLAASLVLAWRGPAAGAGFYIGDVGTRGLARGGALVAAPSGPLAVHYNPAGLSLARGLELELSVAVVDFQGTFRRRCPCVDPSLVEPDEAARLDAELEAGFASNVARTRTPLTIPFVGLSYGFEPHGLAVGLAVYGPNSGRHDYGLLGRASAASFVERARGKVTRYNALEAPNLEVNYALGVSAEPIPGLRLGFGLALHQTGASQTLHLFADTSFAAGPEDPSWDVPIVLDFVNDPALTWSAGVSWDVPFVPGLTVGGSFRAERTVRADGTIEVDLPRDLAAIARVEGRDVEVQLRTAPIGRFGVQYRWPKRFTAEAALVWEGWEVNDEILIRPRDVSFVIEGLEPVVLGEIVSERNWRDTWSIRVGGELEWLEPELGIQAGWFFEPSAIPPAWLDPSRIDLDKHGLAVGLSTEWLGTTLQASLTYVIMDGVTVEDSQVRNTAPLGFAPELRTTVGNGRYEGAHLIGAVSLRFALDPFLEAVRPEGARGGSNDAAALRLR